MKWRSMESAPKDGSKIRVRCAHGEDTARWHPNGCWVASWVPISFRDDSQPELWREQTKGDDHKDKEVFCRDRAKALGTIKNSTQFLRLIDAQFDAEFGK